MHLDRAARDIAEESKWQKKLQKALGRNQRSHGRLQRKQKSMSKVKKETKKVGRTGKQGQSGGQKVIDARSFSLLKCLQHKRYSIVRQHGGKPRQQKWVIF